MNDFLTKPVQAEQLMQTLWRHAQQPASPGRPLPLD
jgi:hypothetical protein